MGKALILLVLLFLLIPIASAVYQKELPLDFTTSCSNINCSLGWNITILNPNSTILIDNEAMSVGDYYANYTFTPKAEGTYLVYLTDTDGAESYDTSLVVNYSGLDLTEGKAILYMGLFAMLVLVFLVNFFGIGLLPAQNTRDEEGTILSISYLKYARNVLWLVQWMLLIAILYLISNLCFAYLGEQMFAKFFFVLFQITFGLTPVILIVWVIWLFVGIAQDKQLKRLMEKGVFMK